MERKEWLVCEQIELQGERTRRANMQTLQQAAYPLNIKL